jgi:hypothetical protein
VHPPGPVAACGCHTGAVQQADTGDDASHTDPLGNRHDSWTRIVADAAIEAEFETGLREESRAEAKRNVLFRLLTIIAGFTIIGLGIAALPLPGPGWLIIIVGLQMLPFEWSRRTIRLIRRRIPGVPEEGGIPARTWAVMGAIVVAFSVLSFLFADDLGTWLSESFGDPDRLFT